MPEFEGRINCIYIDPPYNTGNEGWVYNDAVNDPKIKKWLGKVVGPEEEDLSRHDKWLCMIYPRLKLLHRLLASDGVMLISIDENEYHSLKLVLDEIVGRNHYIGSISWRTRNTDNRVKSKLSVDHEHVICYAKGKGLHGRLIDRSDFKNPDKDPRGVYVTDPLTGKATAEDRPNLHYAIRNEDTGDTYLPDPSRGWITDQAGFNKLASEKRIWWPPNPITGKPRKKRFLFETRERMPVSTFWSDIRGQTGADELDTILGERKFAFPKAVDFVCRVLDVATDKNAIILDSFAGSGTTAHAVLKLNSMDNGNRRFILVETMEYAETITAERVRRVVTGYGEGKEEVPGLGGGFDYYTVGERLLQEDGMLNPNVGLPAIRDYVAWSEGIPIGQCAPLIPAATDKNARSPYWMGEANGLGVFFVWDDARATTLDLSLLTQLVKQPGRYLIYADQCALSTDFMRRHGIVYKKIPRDITRL